MNTKKVSTITLALAVLGLVAFAAFASAAYTSSASFSRSGNGYVTNLDAIKSTSNDGNYATITGPQANAGGQILCTLSSTAPAGSTFCVYGGGSGGTIYGYALLNGQWVQLIADTAGGNTWHYGYTSGYSYNTAAVASYSATFFASSKTFSKYEVTTPQQSLPIVQQAAPRLISTVL